MVVPWNMSLRRTNEDGGRTEGLLFSRLFCLFVCSGMFCSMGFQDCCNIFLVLVLKFAAVFE